MVSKKERKGGKVQGSRETLYMFVVIIPFELPLKEAKVEKNQVNSSSFLLVVQPHVIILFVSASIITYSINYEVQKYMLSWILFITL